MLSENEEKTIRYLKEEEEVITDKLVKLLTEFDELSRNLAEIRGALREIEDEQIDGHK